MTVYSCSAVSTLIDTYYNKGGECVQIEEGVLGYGKLILFGDGLKTTIIEEKPYNEWNSGHTIRMYNKCPKKYQNYIQ